MTSGRYTRDIIDDSWEVLVSEGKEGAYFRMGDALVELRRGSHGSYTEALRREALSAKLSRLADYVRLTKEGEETPSHPSRTVTEEMIAVLPATLPELKAIINVPLLARDGRCLTEPGYDRELGIYLDLAGVDIHPVPSTPSPHGTLRERRNGYWKNCWATSRGPETPTERTH